MDAPKFGQAFLWRLGYIGYKRDEETQSDRKKPEAKKAKGKAKREAAQA